MKDDEEQRLWALLAQDDNKARHQLIAFYMPFTRMLAAKLYARRVALDVEFNEYLQFASIGLIEAIDRFKPELGVMFTTFAAQRINGAVLNELADLTELRSQLTMQKEILQSRLNSISEQATKSNLKPEVHALFNQLADMASSLAIGFMLESEQSLNEDELLLEDAGYAATAYKQLQKQLSVLVKCLPKQQRLVIQYHYLQQIPFNVISEMLQLSKGRIAQLHRQALQVLAVHIEKLDQTARTF